MLRQQNKFNLQSQLTIVKLSTAIATKPSRSGTLWLVASSPFKKMVTPIGCPACVFRLIIVACDWDRTVNVWDLANC